MRIVIIILTAFIALTSIGGGVAMLTGVDQFPLEWLHSTPFKNYTIPALLLSVIVGGFSLLSFFLTIKKHPQAPQSAIVAGISISGYVTIEAIILEQNPPGPTSIELLYIGLGIVLIALAIILKRKALSR